LGFWPLKQGARVEERIRIFVALLVSRGRVPLSEVRDELGLPVELVLERLKDLPLKVEEGVIYATDPAVLILKCWEKGMDPLELALRAGWRDFERLCAKALELSGFQALTNVRFKGGGALRELDVVALREPRILALDCKRWLRRRESSLRAAAQAHRARCEAFAQALASLPRIAAEVAKWRGARVVPAIVDLHEASMKVSEGVPIVPIYKLPAFVHELEVFEDELYTIPVDVEALRPFRSLR